MATLNRTHKTRKTLKIRKAWAATLILALSALVPATVGQTATAAPQTIHVAYDSIRVALNGELLNLTDESGNPLDPFTCNDRVYLPLRVICESLGLTVNFDNASGTVNITGDLSTNIGTPENAPNGGLPTGQQTDGLPQGVPSDPSSSNGTPPEPPTGNPPSNSPGGPPPDGQSQTGNPGEPPDGGPQGPNAALPENVPSNPTEADIYVDYSGLIVVINGETVAMADEEGRVLEPFTYQDRIYLPLRVIAESLGLEVEYDPTSRTVYLQAAGGPAPSTQSSPQSSVEATAAYSIDGDEALLNGQEFQAAGANESCVLASNGADLTLTGSTLSKSGDSSSEENSNFTGLNAACLATSGARIRLEGCSVTTDGEGSNGVFATGEGTVVEIENTTIHTSQNSSRGLDATYDGTIIAINVDIATQGAHCAALATDRGEGTVTVTGGTMKTAGEGSPGIYSTGDITVADSVLEATGSEAAVVEGKNSITLTNTILSGAKKCGVMLYQSFSGDADVGTSFFTMTGGELKAAVGPLFYCTNTNTVVKLKNAVLTGKSGILLNASADRWGTSGSNGAEVSFQADNQTLSGDVICDKISSISLVLGNQSALAGTVNGSDTARFMKLTLDAGSIWTLTGDSYVDVLADGDQGLANIKDNGFNVYYDSSNPANEWLGGKTIALQGGGRLTPQ